MNTPPPTSESSRASRGRLVLTVAAAALFLGLRIALARRLPLFNDEAMYLYLVQEILEKGATPLISFTLGKPPLFTTWLWLFGRLNPDHLLLAGRAAAITASAIAGLLAWRLGRKLAGDGGGILALFLFSSNPYLVLHDSLALYESLSSVLELAMLSFLLGSGDPSLTRRQRLLRGIGAGLFWAAALFHKYYFSLFYLALAGLALVDVWRRRTSGNAGFSWIVHPVTALSAALVAGTASLIVHSLPNATAMVQDATSVLFPLRDILHDPLIVLRAPKSELVLSLLLYIPAPAWLFIPIALFGTAPRTAPTARELAWFWLLILLPPLILLHVPFSRYLHLTYPLLLLATAASWPAARVWLSATARPGQATIRRFVVGLLIAVEAGSALWLAADPVTTIRMPPLDRYQYVVGWPAGWGLPELAESMKREGVRTPVAFASGEAIIPCGLPVLAGRRSLPQFVGIAHQGGVPTAEDVKDFDWFLFNQDWPAPVPAGWRPVFSYDKPGGVGRLALFRLPPRPPTGRPRSRHP